MSIIVIAALGEFDGMLSDKDIIEEERGCADRFAIEGDVCADGIGVDVYRAGDGCKCRKFIALICGR